MVNEADTCVYQLCRGKGVILCMYVDDILIFGTNIDEINDVKSYLSENFDMKDLGEADVILNIKLKKGEHGISLLQSHYVEKVLSHFGYMDNNPLQHHMIPVYYFKRTEDKERKIFLISAH